MTERTPAVLVVDQDASLTAAVHRAAAMLRPVPAVAGVRTLGGVDSLAQAADVVLAGPSTLTKGGLIRLAALHQRFPNASFVLAVSGRPAGTLRQLVQIGADDMVGSDADEAELALVLERSLEIARKRRELEVVVPAPQPAGSLGRATGQIITVVSPTGGGGKTFAATNLAVYLARRGKKVVLVDLDLQFGEVTTALRLRADATMTDAFRHDGDEILFEDQLSACLLPHGEGFSVLAAPRDPAEADFIGGAHVTRILETLRAQAEYVIIDTPPVVSPTVNAAIELSDRLLVMGAADGPSLHNLVVFWGVLKRLGVPRSRLSLVLNKVETDVGFDVAAAEALFPGGFQAILPYHNEVSRSLNLGEPLIAARPDSEICLGLVTAFESLLPEAERTPAPADAPAKARRLRLRPGRPIPADAAEIVVGPAAVRAAPSPELIVFPDHPEPMAPPSDEPVVVAVPEPAVAPETEPEPAAVPQPAAAEPPAVPARPRRHTDVVRLTAGYPPRPSVPTPRARTRPPAARQAVIPAPRHPDAASRERGPPPSGLVPFAPDVRPCGRGASPLPPAEMVLSSYPEHRPTSRSTIKA